MLIKSVELKNIKSYQHETVHFLEGINGICGQNGHGKTTLLEAIGYVLFNYLPYKESDFLRHGEKSGSVSVEVMVNGASYTLTRKLGNTKEYSVRGPNLNITGERDVLTWLIRNLFPLESVEELPRIFENAVGVPQGMFTAAFTETPAKRKKTFDEILRVDEYRNAYDNLRSAMNLIDESVRSIDYDIEKLKIRTESYEKKKEESVGLGRSIESLKSGLKECTQSFNSVKRDLEEKKKLKEEVEKLKSEIKEGTSKVEVRKQQLKKANEELNLSEEAQKLISELSDTKEKYEEAKKSLDAHEVMRKEHDSLRDNLNKIQNELSLLGDKQLRLNSLKASIEKYSAEKNSLLPVVEDQALLERKIDSKNQERAVAIKEIDNIKSRMSIAGTENICPVIKGLRCGSVKDFSSYFKQQLTEAEKNLNEAAISLKALESQLKALRDPRSKVNAIDLLIKNGLDDIAKLGKEIEKAPEKGNAARGLEKEIEKYRTLDSDISGLKRQIKELEPYYQKYLQNQSAAARLTEHKKECEMLEKAIANEEDKLRGAQERDKEIRRSFSEEELIRIQRMHDELLAKVRGYQVEIKEKDGQQHRLNKEITEMEKYLVDIEKLKLKLENEKRFRDYAKFIRETLRDSAQYIVLEFIGEISEEGNNLYCAIMDDFSQELRWNEDYGITVKESGEEKSFALLSGGEKMGAALAVRLALLKILSNSDFVFLDEPTQNLDEIRREKLSEQILNIRGFKQVFVISHDDTFNEKYTNVIRIQKIDGQSRVEKCLT